MKTITTFDHRPSPNHSITSGRNTSRGVALNAVMNGSSIAFERARAPDQHAERQPDHDRQAKPDREAGGAHPQRLPDRAGREHLPQRAGDLARRGEEQLGAGRHRDQVRHELPHEQQHRDAADAEERRLEALPEASRRRERVVQRAQRWSARTDSPCASFLLPDPPRKRGALRPADAFRQHHRDRS